MSPLVRWWRLALSAAVVVVSVGIAELAPAVTNAAAATVTAVWPRAGPMGGGTPITVVGAGFTGATAVTVDGVDATNVTVVSNTVLHATAPPSATGTPGSGDVEVVNSTGTSAPTPRDTFAYRVGGVSLDVPSYIYPGTVWSQIDVGHPPVDLAIINPASGPGTSPDPNYAAQVVTSQSAGVDVIGYVHTSYGAQPLSTVEQEIADYESWYHVDGIFVDEASTSCSLEASYYAPLYAYIHAQSGLDLTVLNPGEATNQCYMNASDLIMSFEGTPASLAATGASPRWVAGYDPSRFWNVVYDASLASLPSVLSTVAADGAREVYVTDQNLPNPYGALPSYWAQELTAAEGPGTALLAQSVTFTTVPPGSVTVGSTYTVGATGGASGQPVVVSIDPSSAGACRLSGSTVTFTAAGTCVIDANQAGTSSYAPASEGQQRIAVAAGSTPTTTATTSSTAATRVAPVITSAAALTVAPGTRFTFSVTATGVPAPTVHESGNLPSGVTFTAAAGGTATIAGSARRGRVYRVTITAANGVAPGATQTFTLTVS